MMLTSIITVNFNQPAVTIAFLNSIKDKLRQEDIEVILVDNGSAENHENDFKAIYPNLTYIYSEVNLGFAGGNNLGIRAAKGAYLLFLNNDTEVTSNLINVCQKEMELNPEIGLLSPLILYYDQPDVIQYAGFTEMSYLTGRNSGIGSMEINKQQFEHQSRETGYCHGAAMMCRSEDLKTAGLMPELFFLYYEELDWCEKFKKSGKKIWFTGKTYIYHKESISVGKESILKTYFMTRNRMLFIRRNTGILNTVIFSIYYIFFASLKQVLVYLFKGRLDLVKAVLKGLIWNFTNSKESTFLGYKF